MNYSYTVSEYFGERGRWTIDRQPDKTFDLLLNGQVQHTGIEDIEDARVWVAHAEGVTSEAH